MVPARRTDPTRKCALIDKVISRPPLNRITLGSRAAIDSDRKGDSLLFQKPREVLAAERRTVADHRCFLSWRETGIMEEKLRSLGEGS